MVYVFMGFVSYQVLCSLNYRTSLFGKKTGGCVWVSLLGLEEQLIIGSENRDKGDLIYCISYRYSREVVWCSRSICLLIVSNVSSSTDLSPVKSALCHVSSLRWSSSS